MKSITCQFLNGHYVNQLIVWLSLLSLSVIILVVAGTFAVISLMVGTAVSRYEDECKSLAGGGDYTTAMPVNTTDVIDYSNSSYDNTTLPPGPADEPIEVTLCKVGVATAVTFMTGIIQVSFYSHLQRSILAT